MTPPPGFRLVKAAAWLVPDDCRREWRREWEAELAWAHRRGLGAGRNRLRAVGAIAHAAWLRYDRWRWEMLWHDVAVAARTLVKRPGFLVIAVLTLGLGIGANAAMFSAVRAVLLRPLPFEDPDRLVSIATTTVDRPDAPAGSTSPPDLTDWRRDVEAFAEVAGSVAGAVALTGEGAAEQVPNAQVTGGFFPILGVAPLHGRWIDTRDDPFGSPDVVVLSHALWQRRFGGRPEAVGTSITLDGRPTLVAGVMPEAFSYPLGSELWVPLRFSQEELRTQRGAQYLDVIARLAPGATLAGAEDALRAYARRLAELYPKTNARRSAKVRSLHDALVGDVGPALRLLLGAVGLVFLIVCVNLANLVLGRAMGRQRELAVRTALGAGRGRLVRGLLAEAALVAVAGGAAGLLVGQLAARAMATFDGGVRIPFLDESRIDLGVAGFTLILAALAAGLSGLMPGWQASRRLDLARGLREDSTTATRDRSRHRVQSGLIVIESALAVALMVGAGLLLRSFVQLAAVDLGFDTHQVQTVSISLPESRYPAPASRAEFVGELMRRISAHPDVQSAGAVFGLPLTGFGYGITTATIDGRKLDDDEQDARILQIRVVTPDYLRSMGIPIRRGRGIEPGDVLGALPVVVPTETAAALLWPGLDPLGHQMTLGTRLGQGGLPAGGTVVGVAGDVRDRGPATPVRPTVFLAHAQFPMDFVSVAIRTRGAPGAVVAPVRRLVADLDAEVPVFRARTMTQLAADAVARPRLFLTLLGLFAGMAVVLAAVGLYGVLAQAVGQRTREIGVRMALGANRSRVVRLVAGQALLLSAAGVTLGLVLAGAFTRLLRGLLFGIEPLDPPTYAAVVAGFLAVATVAAIVPARRAAMVDPLTALRAD